MESWMEDTVAEKLRLIIKCLDQMPPHKVPANLFDAMYDLRGAVFFLKGYLGVRD